MTNARRSTARDDPSSEPGAAGSVLVVGDVIDDVLVRPLAAEAADTDTLATISARPGGSGANQAAWLGALGTSVRFAGRVGAADLAAHDAELRAAGVDARLVPDHGTPTGTIVVLSRDGRRDMYTDRGANLNLGPADLGEELLDGVGLLHVSGYSLFHPGVAEAVGGLMRRARTRGVPVSVDPASAAYLDAAGSEAFRTWSAGARLVFPNLAEGRRLTGLAEPDAVAGALAESYEVVALKLGADGALIATGGRRFAMPSEPATVVDTTGAGDAFCAGYLIGWLTGRPPAECARSALRAAARAVATLGARPEALGGQERPR